MPNARLTLPLLATCIAAGQAASMSPAFAQQTVIAIVGAQRSQAGNPPGVRASNAKGVCVQGDFTPTAEAAALSTAPIFAKPTPLTARFAMGGGNPRISDATKGATRGFSMRFAYEGGDMSLLFISTPMFAAKTPEQLLGFLQVRQPGPNGTPPDAEKLREFSAANPNTLLQAAYLNSHPVPASFAGIESWGVQAYTLTNAKGEKTVIKFKTTPTAGLLNLTDDEAKAKPADFYIDDLKERLAKAPVTFDMQAIIGQPGDVTDDSTASWPEESRTKVKLGTIAIAAIIPDATCNAATFNPVVLPAGIAGPANDPMFAVRALAYAVSFSGRQ